MKEEYIERNALLAKNMENVEGEHHLQVAQLLENLMNAPVADVTKVVRCKKCKHRGKLYRSHLCDHPEALLSRVTDEDFCSHGEE